MDQIAEGNANAMDFSNSVHAVIILTCITMGAGDRTYSFKVMFTHMLMFKPFTIPESDLLRSRVFFRLKSILHHLIMEKSFHYSQIEHRCYGEYGCFSNEAPFSHLPLPSSLQEINVTLYIARQSPGSSSAELHLLSSESLT